MKRAPRKDALHQAVGNIFAQHGWDTLDLAAVGDGCPDWMMARGTIGFLVEVKTKENRRPGRHDERGLTEPQQKFFERWKSKVYIVASVEEVWRILDEYKAFSLEAGA